MRRFCFTTTFLFFSSFLFAQKYEDNLITVTVSDTARLYERVRQAIVFSNFMIRENSTRDTLWTHPEKMYTKTIYVIAKVIIAGNTVMISGAFGLGMQDFWGKAGWPKSYKQIVYYKGSDAWPVLRQIALKLDAKIEYSRTESD